MNNKSNNQGWSRRPGESIEDYEVRIDDWESYLDSLNN